MHVCAKSSGVALELAYTRPPGSTTFANWLFSNPPWYTLFAPQILHKLLSSNALGKMQYSQEHFKTMVYAEFGGANRVYYGEFENREYPHPQGMTRRARTPQLSGECMGPPPIDWCIMTEPRDLRRQWKIKKSLPEIISKFKKMSFIPVTNCWFSHDVTKIQTTKLSILPRFYLHDVLEQLKTNFHTNFRLKRVLGFVIEYAWISNLLRDAAFTWRPREEGSCHVG